MNDQHDDLEGNFIPENYNKYLEDGKPILINIVIEEIKKTKKKGEHKEILMNSLREYEVGTSISNQLFLFFTKLFFIFSYCRAVIC